MSKEAYDPVPLILEELFWVAKAVRQFSGSPNEVRLREIGKHLESELKKYLIR